MGPRRHPLPGGWGTRPRRLRPCARPTFADGVLRLVVRVLVKMRAGRGACDRGRPALTGGAQGSAQGEGSVFAVMAGVGLRAQGEGGFCSHRGYYWGGIVCPLVGCAALLTLWMPILPTHASGVDLSVAHEASGPQPRHRARGRAYRLPVMVCTPEGGCGSAC